MVTVPSFLLRRLYVRGSLRNTAQGVQFQLMNKLGAGYARELLPLEVDGREVPREECTFSIDGRRLGFDAVSEKTPFTLELNKTTTISITGLALNHQPHRINMGFKVAGLGTLQFDFVDVPSDE